MVGRLRKPHGLKGDCTVFPLTDEPGTGRSRPGGRSGLVDLAGEVVGEPLDDRAEPGLPPRVADEVRRDRVTGTGWSRGAGSSWRRRRTTLTPPAEGEVYLHELDGFAVRIEDGTPLGLVTGVLRDCRPG